MSDGNRYGGEGLRQVRLPFASTSPTSTELLENVLPGATAPPMTYRLPALPLVRRAATAALVRAESSRVLYGDVSQWATDGNGVDVSHVITPAPGCP